MEQSVFLDRGGDTNEWVSVMAGRMFSVVVRVL